MRLPISQAIKRLRKEKGITQEELACVLGVTFQSVSRWENDIAYPDVELIPEIANYFGVTTDVLFGTDETTQEFKRNQYIKSIDETEQCENFEKFYELENILKKAVKDFPHDVYFQWKLCSLYWRMGLEHARKNLDTMRHLAQFVIENDKSINGSYRIGCIRVMIRVEDEDKLENWTKYVSESFYTSLPSIMASRFSYRNESGKYNEQIQKNLRDTLVDTFNRDFCKRDCENLKDAKSCVEGTKIILKIIDVMRDPAQETDAWIAERAFAKLRLAKGLFGCGKTEEGFEALENSVDLYMKFCEIPEGTVLKYNCHALDLLSITVNQKCREVSMERYCEVLTNTDGGEWFNSVRDTDRFKRCVAKAEKYKGQI